MNIASELLRLGDFRPNEVAERVFSNKSLNKLHLLSMAMGTVELFEDNQIAIMYVIEEMLEETVTTNDDTEGFVVHPVRVRGIKAGIVVQALGDGVKMSLSARSDEVNGNIWAQEIGGRGHKKASGDWHPGPLKKTIEEVVAIGSKQLVSVDKS